MIRETRFATWIPPVGLVLAVGLAFAGDAAPPRMSRYVFGLLRKGPAWTAERTPAGDSIQAGHMANIRRMASEGSLLVAGPLLDDGDLRGVFIFRPTPTARLAALVNPDPAIQSKRLVLDLYDWYAPPGIGAPYRRLARREGFRDSMTTLQLALLERGSQWTDTLSAAMAAMQDAHVAGIARSLASGELASAGTCDGGGEVIGVFIFRGDSAAAHRRLEADPAIRAGRLRAMLHPWLAAWGSMPGDTLAGH